MPDNSEHEVTAMIDTKPSTLAPAPEKLPERLPGETELDFSMRMGRLRLEVLNCPTPAGPLDKATRVWETGE